jgi:uncharacterized membrane protein YphA (DoxX/SURF4 family)
VSSDLRKISWLALSLLVVLRISIGWHLFYEGLWKLSTQKTANPWTAEGYLKNATGPLRTTFRNMTGDANDLRWLDFDAMSAKWDAWRDRFVAHYGTDPKELNRLLDGPDAGFDVAVDLPPDFKFDELAKSVGVAKDAIKYDEKSKKLIVDGKLHLLPTEQAKLLEVLKEEPRKSEYADACTRLTKAINDVAKKASRLAYRERLAAMLKGDPDRVGIVQKAKKEGEPDLVVTVGEVENYKDLARRYEANYAKAKTQFQWDHLERQYSELQQKRRSLVGPVQALEKDLIEDANKLLSTDQLSKGPAPDAATEIRRINFRTMWGLTIFGILLMLGLLTRVSALGGAALLTLFYLAMPPWPGVQEIASIEHNLIVNKVFVEMVALLAIAAMPSGKWFGVDAIISALIHRRKAPAK